MKSPKEQWQQIRADYLKKVGTALHKTRRQERRQILEEVTVHLDRRFGELAPEEQTWENMQQIIVEMGPAEDYADLLGTSPEVKKAIAATRFFFIPIIVIFILILLAILNNLYHRPKAEATPPRPVVLETSPMSLRNDIDPATTEITVTFDQSMMNFSWSWVGSGEHFPELTGNPRYDSERKTCRLPVKLQAGQWYWVGINSEMYVYFQTEKHIPAKPYVILFATRDSDGNPTPIPDDYVDEANRINTKQEKETDCEP